MHLRVKLLGEDEVGGRAGDGDEPADGGGVGDAEGQAFADHVVPLGGILGVSPHLDPLHVWYFNGDLKVGQELTLIEDKWGERRARTGARAFRSCFQPR